MQQQVAYVSAGACKTIISNIAQHKFGKAMFATLACGYGWLFTDPHVFIAVYVLIIFDTLTGFIVAMKSHEVTSRNFFRVFAKMLVYFIMILTGRLMDKIVPISFAATIIESFLVITEGLSVLENLGKLGMPIPAKLIKILKTVQEHKEKYKK